MKKLILPLVAVFLAGAFWYTKSGTAEDELPGIQQAAVSSGDISQAVRAVGTLQPLRTVRVGSQVSGTVLALHADFNSVVKEGQVIAELDPSLLQVQVAVQQANIARQDNDIAHQRVQLTNDQKILQRTRAQFDKGLVSPQTLETATLQVKTRTAQIASAERMKVQAQAQLTQAKLNVSYCTIVSPIDGVVVSRLVDVGQTVQASMNTPQFFMLATDLRTLRLQAGVDEADIGRIRPDMPVTFSVDSYRGETFHGRVDAVRLNAQIQDNVVTYPVWIEVPNPDLRLRPSMTANLQIVVDSATNVVRIPNDALRFRPTSDMYSWLDLPSPGGANRTVALASVETLETGTANRAKLPTTGDVRIDDLFAEVPKRVTPGQVWVYDKANPDATKRLRSIAVRTGVADANFSAIVSGDVQPGLQLVTAVTPPPSVLRQSSGSIFGGPQRGFGGMTKSDPAQPSRLNRGGPPQPRGR